MTKQIKYSFWEFITKYSIKIPIMQRDYAQGREENKDICISFLDALSNSVKNNKPINLDFVYGTIDSNSCFFPLDGQQRLTTLFLLHCYAFHRYVDQEEKVKCETQKILQKFSYETRISSRDFCFALVHNSIQIEDNCESISCIIKDEPWFFQSWEYDQTIRAMLNTLDWIHERFKSIQDLWNILTCDELISFNLLFLEDFGLSDDLYIKMNDRGKNLTHFESLKAEIEEKIVKEKWDDGSFCLLIDTNWTNFLWEKYRVDDSIDDAHMSLITFVLIVCMVSEKIEPLQDVKTRSDLIAEFNENNHVHVLINYINQTVFENIVKCYNLYSGLSIQNKIPHNELVMWNHTPASDDFLSQILTDWNSASYSQKVMLYAQTLYLMNNSNPDIPNAFRDWMRVVRNVVARGNIDNKGKRPDIIRSPEAFAGVIRLVKELSLGCSDIYTYLATQTVSSSFAKEQIQEEQIKARIIVSNTNNKQLIHDLEDNDLLRGKILIALQCAGFQNDETEINFNLLEKINKVFATFFNSNLDDKPGEEDKLRRCLLTIDVSNQFCFYSYWKSIWYMKNLEKFKLLSNYRELEYLMESENKAYFQKLILLLIDKNYEQIINDFEKPDNMPNWQFRLIKENGLLMNHCRSCFIAISDDQSFCYLLSMQRPSSEEGCEMIQ